MTDKIEVDPQAIEELKALHRRDIQTIAERMFREARSRRWCSDFGDIVDELNAELHVPIERPITKWRVEVYLTVEARDADGARAAAVEAIGEVNHRIEDIDQVG